VSFPVKARYLQALGFLPTKEVEIDLTDDLDLTIDGPSPEKSALNPHEVWLSADGAWVRRTDAFGGTNTLAGDVADLVQINNPSQAEQVWASYKADTNQADRDQLIVFYSPLVKYVAGRVAAGLPQNVDQADLVSYGMFGLIDAITKFDPERGFKFETYAISRIKGAVLDELRSIDWVPRSVRAKAKSVERAMSKLETKHHRAPSDEEIADELDLTMGQLTTLYNQISSLGMVALDEMLSFGGGESMTLGDTLADRRDGPGGQYERIELRQMLADAINRMGEREKIVLTLYYYESLTLAEIGNVLGVTESRVCQIHTKAVLHLRSRLAAQEREAV
jgi:RNA polymerase sigma factor for flagellar operon FliA